MYAVVRTGSKQYKVSPGDRITVEKLDIGEGKKHNFEDVVLYHDGQKLVTNSKELAKVRVSARVIGQGRSDKTVVFKYKPKKGYHKKKGHRQQLTRLEIEDIVMRKTAPRPKAAAAGKAKSTASAGGEQA
jgi:large subunit ribosomal protein L21